jgi:hypothetical protein
MTPNAIHTRLIDAAALASSVAETMIHYRHVHPDDRNKADMAAVVNLLARDLAELRDQLEKAL